MSTNWGRSAVPPTHLGRRSIIYALAAFALALGCLLLLGLTITSFSEPWNTLALIVFSVAILIVAPALHFAGVCTALKGMRAASDSLAASLIGLLLNCGLLATGVFLVWLLVSELQAFR